MLLNSTPYTQIQSNGIVLSGNTSYINSVLYNATYLEISVMDIPTLVDPATAASLTSLVTLLGSTGYF